MTHSNPNPGQGSGDDHSEGRDDHGKGEHHEIVIFIDEQRLVAPSKHMTGEQLRNLPLPPVQANRDLWLEVPGAGDDQLIRPEKKYTIRQGSRYYTAPSTINPGRK